MKLIKTRTFVALTPVEGRVYMPSETLATPPHDFNLDVSDVV
jgi:hypothetical protein